MSSLIIVISLQILLERPHRLCFHRRWNNHHPQPQEYHPLLFHFFPFMSRPSSSSPNPPKKSVLALFIISCPTFSIHDPPYIVDITPSKIISKCWLKNMAPLQERPNCSRHLPLLVIFTLLPSLLQQKRTIDEKKIKSYSVSPLCFFDC